MKDEVCLLFLKIVKYNGNLSPLVTYPVGSGPSSIASDDVDGDSRPDLVVANYYNGSATSTDVVSGAENYMTYSANFSSGQHEEHWKLWIDYNHDGDFEDDGEKVFGRKSSSKKMLVRKFTIPTTALLGSTRMRLSMERNSSPDCCDVFDYGEVEDYTINIVSQLPAPNSASEISATIFPNPTNGVLTVDMHRAETGTVYIFDLQGQAVQSFSFSDRATLELNTSLLSPGIYFLQIATGENISMVKKFIKQ